MKLFLNLIAATLAVFVSLYFKLHMNLSDVIPSDILRAIFSSGAVYIAIFGAGSASISYGFVQALERLVMKADKFSMWLFMAMSVPLSAALSVLTVNSLFP